MVEVFLPQYLPMLVPPVPWIRNNMGGHLTLRNTGKTEGIVWLTSCRVGRLLSVIALHARCALASCQQQPA